LSKGVQGLALLCRVDSRLCALPLAQVVETMRPLPVDPVAGLPGFILGLSIIRGIPVAVVDGRALLGGGDGGPRASRFVIVRAGDHHVALAVDEVIGVHEIAVDSVRDLPPLVKAAHGDAVSALGALDAELLVVLEGARMLSDDAWATLGAREASP
jgi:purine-binding chemotaxis protein CheW